MSKKLNFDAMSVDEMWRLHETIIEILSERLTSEKRELETRLATLRRDQGLPRLKSEGEATEPRPERRKFPTVSPKYRNPDHPSETWSGRGSAARLGRRNPSYAEAWACDPSLLRPLFSSRTSKAARAFGSGNRSA